VTNGLQIASELAGCPGIAVVLPGGWVRWEALSVVGTIGSGVFDRINVQTAFVGAAGFTFETGLSDATEEEAQIKRSMIAVAHEVIAIVDHTKWGHSAFATFCRTEELTGVISDRSAPELMVTAPEARAIEISLVPCATDPAVDGVPIRPSRVDRRLEDTPTSTSSLVG
jgi:DeoR/GlpR family transcriptional regulator of sugar metabolism